jgi:hypothetical protein
MVSAGDVLRLADHCAINARIAEDRAGDGGVVEGRCLAAIMSRSVFANSILTRLFKETPIRF